MPSHLLATARDHLIQAGITGRHQSHSRENVLSKIFGLLEGEGDDSFGLSGFEGYSAGEILAFVAELTGCSPDVADPVGGNDIDPDLTIQGIVAAGRRLGEAARRGESLFIATGHPTGLLEHHMRVADAYQAAGGKLLRLRENESLLSGRGSRTFQVRYIGGVGCLADWGSLRHTHSARPMEALLDAAPWPDLVLGDHGFAGAAIEREIPTIAIMDINDPALAVAWAEKKDVLIVPMDDNRTPRDYEPAWRIFEELIAGREL